MWKKSQVELCFVFQCVISHSYVFKVSLAQRHRQNGQTIIGWNRQWILSLRNILYCLILLYLFSTNLGKIELFWTFSCLTGRESNPLENCPEWWFVCLCVFLEFLHVEQKALDALALPVLPLQTVQQNKRLILAQDLLTETHLKQILFWDQLAEQPLH